MCVCVCVCVRVRVRVRVRVCVGWFNMSNKPLSLFLLLYFLSYEGVSKSFEPQAFSPFR